MVACGLATVLLELHVHSLRIVCVMMAECVCVCLRVFTNLAQVPNRCSRDHRIQLNAPRGIRPANTLMAHQVVVLRWAFASKRTQWAPHTHTHTEREGPMHYVRAANSATERHRGRHAIHGFSGVHNTPKMEERHTKESSGVRLIPSFH